MLGSECVKKFMKIDARIIDQIIVKKEELNSMKKEVLAKMNSKEIDKQLFLLDNDRLPNLFREQLSLGLPLCDKQLTRVFKLLTGTEKEHSAIKKLNRKQLTFLNELEDKEEKKTLIISLSDGKKIYTLDELEKTRLSEIALQKVALNLPLSYKDIISYEMKFAKKNITNASNQYSNKKECKRSNTKKYKHSTKYNVSEDDTKKIYKAYNMLSINQQDFWIGELKTN